MAGELVEAMRYKVGRKIYRVLCDSHSPIATLQQMLLLSESGTGSRRCREVREDQTSVRKGTFPHEPGIAGPGAIESRSLSNGLPTKRKDESGGGKLPVTVLSGFLGAGKTTLLKHLILNTSGYKVAVIVNDMADVNVDGWIVDNANLSVTRTEENLVELSNGCICCTLRQDLIHEVSRIAFENRFQYLLIESTGISEPLPVAQSFMMQDLEGRNLSQIARLDTLVTVVDAFQFSKDFSCGEKLK
ncbi:hypothetical protein GUITHDRAFT_143339 [Guillardia theta CCMP2712]|uniref:CobW/HypB/UreG nucleotide-binding domain-containing protein n=1 Tax=Guillardia theta (strain CCMP2712) TaxID=905079 RepID=L1ITH8_GUITC|nr:hypothetical protein GUITHDRAFT_143339 [Guillardia theta CCMP2712]EKX39538.1 hypothetical protein GUITHDRAFT_143339 [Guillardia theta CCMP2712]|eukprot:XP_005826518.1 hypothetical protein GUITHDRAFT_143339 [Guillardia theta CCMP2712]